MKDSDDKKPTSRDAGEGAASLSALVRDMRTAVAPFRNTLKELHAAHQGNGAGAVADYIPELAKADPGWFGISVVTADGQIFEVGDSQQLFSIQSVSKPFVYGQALADHGRDGLLKKVGVEPSGEVFSSITLDPVHHRPFNPMVNAGAIAVTDLIRGKDYPDRVHRLMSGLSGFCGRELYVDNAVFMSERVTGHRNRAIADLMRNFEAVGEDFEESLELYFQQCSVIVSARDLAVMGATLANGGVNPLTSKTVIDRRYVQDVLSVMLSCGMYDYAGEWIYRVGLPAKSGVSGGIVAVVPGLMGVGLYSPPLDEKGNSVRGLRACEDLSKRFGLHVFAAAGSERQSLRDQLQLAAEAGPV